MPFPYESIFINRMIQKLKYIMKKDIPPKDMGRAPSVTSIHNGSITVEAALVMPIFILALVVLIQVMSLMNTQLKIQRSLYAQTSRLSSLSFFVDTAEIAAKLGVEEYKNAVHIGINGVSSFLIEGLVKEDLGDEFFDDSCIKGGRSGLNAVINIGVSPNSYEVILTYELNPKFNIFLIKPLRMFAKSGFSSWTGTTKVKTEEAKEGEKYYITPSGTVYHLYNDCSYIKVKLYSTTYSESLSLRNASEGKYYPCSSCFKYVNSSMVVYYSKYGDRIHSDATCKKIHHNVMEVGKDEIEGRRLCLKCMERSEKND